MISNPQWAPVNGVKRVQYATASPDQETAEFVAIVDDDGPLFSGTTVDLLWWLYCRDEAGFDTWPNLYMRVGAELVRVWLYGGTPGQPDEGWSQLNVSTYGYEVIASVRWVPASQFHAVYPAQQHVR